MFERFSLQSRRAVVLSQEEARSLGHSYIGTEHLLIALLALDDAPVDGAVEGKLTPELAREAVREVIGPGGRAPAGHIPFTPRAKKVLELALREALRLRHREIQPGHIFLGVLSEGEGVGAQVLSGAGVDFDKARAAIEDALGPGTAPPELPTARGFLRSFRRRPTPDVWTTELESDPEAAFTVLAGTPTDAAAAAVERARGEALAPTGWSLLAAIAAGEDMAASLLAGLDLSAAPADDSARSFVAVFGRARELASALGPEDARIDTLHLLAVLLSPGEGSVADDLAARGADPGELRRKVLALL